MAMEIGQGILVYLAAVPVRSPEAQTQVFQACGVKAWAAVPPSIQLGAGPSPAWALS